MNTARLKLFAPQVRRQLMDAVERKLDYVLSGDSADLRAMSAARDSLGLQAEQDRAGIVERVAYTWFNRFAALRFMDARGWHPFNARILTAANSSETQPELLKITRGGSMPAELRSHTDPTRLGDILDGRIPSPDPQGEVYRQLVLAGCRFYHSLLPDLFEKIDDETELLLPDDLLTEHSVVHGFRTEISDDDCADGPKANVEILGWLYQFYISERKDQVMARKSAVPTEDIPAVTQLFTPHWIVRYLVENSLGRLWMLNRPESRLREHMPYYIEGETGADFLRISKPEEIKLCDPACGSGHMLTYAYDLLALIYEEDGYAPTDIPALILRHNLHGLEICPRAAQLAELALVFKAREKSRRFFQPEHHVRPSVIDLRDVRFGEEELRDYIHALELGAIFNESMLRLLRQFEDAKNCGSLIQPCFDERGIAFARHAIEAKDLGGHLFLRETHLKVLRVLEQAAALTQRYHVVVANPPYMGSGQMNPEIRAFAKGRFPDSKTDLFAMFIERGFLLAVANGFSAMVTMQSWMFLASFEDLRKKLIQNQTIRTLAHLDNMVMGIAFGTVATVWENTSRSSYMSQFSYVCCADLSDDGIPREFPIKNERLKYVCGERFMSIPGYLIAYWLSDKVIGLLAGDTLAKFGHTKRGLQPGDVPRMVRSWWEVGGDRLEMAAASRAAAVQSKKRWFKFDTGGPFRKWYGNNNSVVDWENNGQRIKSGSNPIVPSEHLYFEPGFVWSRLTSGLPSFRLHDAGVINGDMSPCFFPNEFHRWTLGLLNGITARHFLSGLSPTLTFLVSDILKIPSCEPPQRVPPIVDEAVQLARADWDNFETSWDFCDQPLLRPSLKGATLESSWRNWQAESTAAFCRMQELETENNRLYIAAYGLEGELQPEVPEEQITLARAEARRDMAAFLSYAVGCMMGRYSPDQPGLILANAGDSRREFLETVGKPLAELTFAPDEDGIIPVLDGEWFGDDIVARTREFLCATFGEAKLEANIRFIEESVGKDLRRYFLSDFYKDHLQTYKKRPIYWMFQSPRKGFSALVYMHRYTKDTANTVLNRYLRDYLQKMRSRLEHLEHLQLVATATREKNAARKESDGLRKTIRECEDYERDILLPLAQQRIELDLDDGVKVNYLKLGNALAPIAGLAAKESD